jgi:hypothetical protein
MHRILTLITLAVVFTGCSVTGDIGGLPEQAHSDYFVTMSGSFALRLDDQRTIASCRYSLLLAPRQSASYPLYLHVLFENPADSKSALTTNMVVEAGSGDIHISSPEVRGLKSGRNYRVEVLVFDTADRVHQVGQHIQYIRFTKPSFVK